MIWQMVCKGRSVSIKHFFWCLLFLFGCIFGLVFFLVCVFWLAQCVFSHLYCCFLFNKTYWCKKGPAPFSFVIFIFFSQIKRKKTQSFSFICAFVQAPQSHHFRQAQDPMLLEVSLQIWFSRPPKTKDSKERDAMLMDSINRWWPRAKHDDWFCKTSTIFFF